MGPGPARQEPSILDCDHATRWFAAGHDRLGLWLADAFYFSTDKNSRKARNLAENPHCVIASENPAEAVIVEGVVESVTDPERLEPL